jgi:hypothetical protein
LLKYAAPICFVLFLIVNLVSLAPPFRKARSGRKMFTLYGWIVYLSVNFAVIWGLVFALFLGRYELHKQLFWLITVFGVIAAARIGFELSIMIRFITRSEENLERSLILQQEVERLRRQVKNEETSRREHQDSLRAELREVRSGIAGEARRAAGEEIQRYTASMAPGDAGDPVPDPALLLKDSSAGIPVELLKKEVEEAGGDFEGNAEQEDSHAGGKEGGEDDPAMLLKDSSADIPAELLKKEIVDSEEPDSTPDSKDPQEDDKPDEPQ